jgi:uncharacterized protein (TIGR02646 family)
MDRFQRTAEPDYLQAARDELCQGEYLAHHVWERFRQRNVYDQLRSKLLSISNETCAFCAGGFAQSPVTVEHFEPKAGPHENPKKVLAWENLFPSCYACQLAKGSKFSTDLIKPDLDHYQPASYFLIDVDDGALKPAPHAQADVQSKVIKTIETYGLDRPALKKERKQKLRQMLKNQDDGDNLSEYRFLKELFA